MVMVAHGGGLVAQEAGNIFYFERLGEQRAGDVACARAR